MQALIFATVALVMLVVGTGMSMAGLRRALNMRGAIVVGLAFQWLALPALAAAINRLLGAPSLVAMTLMLVAISPGGALSNAYTYLARANTELSVALTSLSTVLAVFTVPLLATVWLADLGAPVSAALLTLQLGATVLLPVVLGMIVVARRPEAVQRAQPLLRALVLAGIVVILVAVFMQHGAAVLANAWIAAVATLVFTGVAFVATALVSAVLRLVPADRWAMLFELSTRNLAVASLVGAAIGTPEVIAIAAVALLIQTSAMLVVAQWAGRRAMPAS